MEGVLQQQRADAELIAARLFRFRARRSVGVLYSLLSVVPIVSLMLWATTPFPITIVGAIALTVTIWFVARSSGFAELARMQYNLDFLKGAKGTVYDARKDIWLARRTNLAWFLASVWPWFGYIVATVEGFRLFAALFMVIFVGEFLTLAAFSHYTGRDSVFEWKVEDRAFVLGDICIAFLAIIPGAPDWTWAIAAPLFVLCGTKSLYDAPKELAIAAP